MVAARKAADHMNNIKTKKGRKDLKISNLPNFDTNDISVPKGMDPRMKDMPNWQLYEKKLKRKQEQMRGVQLPPV